MTNRPQGWPPRDLDEWRDTSLNVTWWTRLDGDGRPEFYEPFAGPGRVSADRVDTFLGGIVLVERPVPFEAPPGVVWDEYLAGRCGHKVSRQEWLAGYRVCERCPQEESAR